MKKVLIIPVVLLLALGGGGYAGYNWWNNAVYQPAASASHPVSVHVSEGESPDAIGAQLYKQRLIRSQQAFMVYTRYTGVRGRFQAGDFPLNRNMSMAQIVARLTHGEAALLTIRLQEGDTMQQMAQAIQGAGLGNAQNYLAAARPAFWQTQYGFLQGLPPTAPANLEGFLFPDTYRVNPGDGPRGVVENQLARFGQVLTPELRAQIAQPATGRPAESLWDVVVLASIVEREVNKDPDRAIVCGIFYNRLAAGMALGSDVTVLYGLGETKGDLTADQLADPANLYNTRVHTGLPPGPISNPGLASLKACVTPQPSDYYYFFVDQGGTTRFAANFDEFQQQQAQFGVG